MKWAGGYQPPTINQEPETWDEYRRVWELRRQIREQQAVFCRERLTSQEHDPDTLEQLLQVARIAIKRPNASQVVDDTPEVVAWLRAQMTASGPKVDDEPKASGKPGSKPPFRIAYMNAADREVATLVYWAQEYGLAIPRGLWRVSGVAAGVFSSRPHIVDGLAADLAVAVAGFSEPDGLYDHPKWGLWTVRSQHFANWPALAAMFASEAVEPVVESEQLELL